MSKQAVGLQTTYSQRTILAMVVVALIGIISRALPVGWLILDKYLGDAIYAAVFYLILSLIRRESTIPTKAIQTAIYVLAIEVFQLTQIPLTLSQSNSFLIRAFTYIVLGSKFGWLDIVAYTIGIGGIILVDKLYLRGHWPAGPH